MPVFSANGSVVTDVWAKTREAVEYSRTRSAPAVVVYSGLPRRFGHAATDRQGAYLSPAEILAAQRTNPLAGACAMAVAAGHATMPELLAMFDESLATVERAFNAAVREPKVETREQMLERVAPPLAPVQAPRSAPSALVVPGPPADSTLHLGTGPRPAAPSVAVMKTREVMRKHMTGVIDETLEQQKDVVYVGEDVTHGGYYLVTEASVWRRLHPCRPRPPRAGACEEAPYARGRLPAGRDHADRRRHGTGAERHGAHRGDSVCQVPRLRR
jgi:hypothetical protein